MKKFAICMIVSLVGSASLCFAQETYVDLSSRFDQDAFVADNAAGDPLGEGGSINANSLPEDFVEGESYRASNSAPSFMFGPLRTGSADSVLVDNQTIEVASGNYAQLSLALLSIDFYENLASNVMLNYSDGTSDEVRFGPLPDWFNSPITFIDRQFEWTDTSDVEIIHDLTPQQNDEEFIADITGGSPNEPRDDYRFVDASDTLIYEFDLADDLEEALLSIDMQNNFVVGVSTDIGFTYEEVLNSMEMFGEAVHDGSNRDVYTIDLTPFLEEISDNILWIRFSDATPENGWGPSIFNLTVHQGEPQDYEIEPLADLDTTNAQVHADFRTDGSETEQEYIQKLVGTTISGIQHRFADGTSYVVYGFDLPDEASEANLAVNMEGNFEVSASSTFDLETFVNFTPGSNRDEEFIVENTAQDAGSYRFVDGESRLMYSFDLPDDIESARLNLDMENNFVVSVGPNETDLTEELNSFEMFGEDFHDASNRDVYEVDLTPYLDGNSSNEIFVLFQDGSPGDGWGPAIRDVSIVSGEEPAYTLVTTAADELENSVYDFETDSTANRKYYTFDLSNFLQENPENTVYVKFADASTDTGFGPGLFRIVMYSGDITIDTHGLAIEGLTNTNLEETPDDTPYPWGLNLMHKSFPVDSSKTLESFTLPLLETEQDVYLFAATLSQDDNQTPVKDWSLF